MNVNEFIEKIKNGESVGDIKLHVGEDPIISYDVIVCSICNGFWTGYTYLVGIDGGEELTGGNVCSKCIQVIFSSRKKYAANLLFQRDTRSTVEAAIEKVIEESPSPQSTPSGTSEQDKLLSAVGLTYETATKYLQKAQANVNAVLSNLPSKHRGREDDVRNMIVGRSNFLKKLDRGLIKSDKQVYWIKLICDILQRVVP